MRYRQIFCYLPLLFLSAQVSADKFSDQLVTAALERTKLTITYDGGYYAIDYPNGDVPANLGVCTDVVIRSYRSLGVDLQVLLHEDLAENFSVYPSKRIWGLTRPDANIDHRRVPNLQRFFTRYGDNLAISNKAKDYQAGHLVTWLLPGNLPHIGIVTDKINTETGNPMIVHNIGRGPELEDMLFSYPISGHYFFAPSKKR